MSLKRIVIAHNFLSPHGGAERSTYTTYQLLKQAGFEVFLYGTTMQPYFEDLPHTELFPEYTDYDKINSPLSALKTIVKPFYNVEAEKKFREFLIRVKPDIVHFGSVHWHLSPSVILPCVEMNIPTVMTLRESRHICPAGTLLRGDNTYCAEVLCVKHTPFRAIMHKCYDKSLVKSSLVAMEFSFRQKHKLFQKVLQFICPSQALATLIKTNGTPAHLVTVIPNFIDDSWIDLPYNSESGHYFLYAGRISPEKGVDTLLNALAKSDRHYPLKIVGDGPETDNLKALASTLGLTQTEFLGHVSPDSLKPLYRDALASVLPCNWFENFGRTVVESMALATPVIGSNIGGIAEIISHNSTGLLVKPGCVDELSAALTHSINNPSTLKTLGINAYNQVQNTYNQTHYLKALLDVYNNVLNLQKAG